MSDESMLQYCIKKASEGDSLGRVRVYSVATDKRGNFLGESLNRYLQSHPTQKLWANRVGLFGKEYLHSELSTLLKAAKSHREVAKIYIARVDKQGNIKDSRPCKICAAYIAEEFPNIEVIYAKENE